MDHPKIVFFVCTLGVQVEPSVEVTVQGWGEKQSAIDHPLRGRVGYGTHTYPHIVGFRGADGPMDGPLLCL